MQVQQMRLPWEEAGWLEEVTTWINDKVTEHGWQIAGPIEVVHQRPWSAFAQVSTNNGTVYFKAPAPMFKYEAALTDALARWRPDCTVPLLAVDLERGWLLSADAGVTLRSLTRSGDQIDHWLKVLPLYVELQIEMADRVPDMLALGVPDRRLATVPQLYRQLLEETDSLRVGLEMGLTHEEYRRLRDLDSHVAVLCEELESYGLPDSIAHEEVHENNVLVGERGYTFTDWSDSSVAHPFFTVLVTLRSIAHWLKLDEAGPEVGKVREAYLEPWTSFATRKQLQAALGLAYRLAMINRALSWYEAIASLPPEQQAPYADSVSGWLQDFLATVTAAPSAGQPPS